MGMTSPIPNTSMNTVISTKTTLARLVTMLLAPRPISHGTSPPPRQSPIEHLFYQHIADGAPRQRIARRVGRRQPTPVRAEHPSPCLDGGPVAGRGDRAARPVRPARETLLANIRPIAFPFSSIRQRI